MTDPIPGPGHPAFDPDIDAQILKGMSGGKRSESQSSIQAVDCYDYIRSFEAPDYLLDRILLNSRLYALTALTGHLKTALATYIGLAVACGEPVCGLETKKCKVLYLSGENDEDQKARTIATMQHFGFKPEPGYFRVISGAGPIAGMLDRIKDIFEEHGPFGLVITDTSIAYFGGEDENKNTEMQFHADCFREITTYAGRPAVVTLCHPIKGAGRENLVPRGGGAYLNAIDGNLTLWRSAERATLHWHGKYRGASFEPVEFGMKLITLDGLADSKGRAVESVVITPMSEHDLVKAAMEEWTNENKVMYEMLHHEGSSMRDIAKAVGWLSEDGKPQAAKVQRIITDLHADKLVQQERKQWILTTRGRELAKAIK